jgi:TatD DNase family protein
MNLEHFMTVDCHAHLDDPGCSQFLNSLRAMKGNKQTLSTFQIFSNSVDFASSRINLKLAEEFPETVFPFVGIHPQNMDGLTIQQKVDDFRLIKEEMFDLISQSAGIGEIGIDPKYGNLEVQSKLFEIQLECSEVSEKPISIHSRESVSTILSSIEGHNISNRILFHWFTGTEHELKILSDRGMYVSFGPSLIYSKRIQKLFLEADESLVLAETDSPLLFRSLSSGAPISPFVVSSVLFCMSKIRRRSFESILATNQKNALEYMKQKTH